VKDPSVIEAAYDDSEGVTAEFNRNVLHVINRELDADFAPDEFDHVAFFDRKHEWVEMRLRSSSAQTVEVAAVGLSVEFEAGEELRTEISAKFTRADVTEPDQVQQAVDAAAALAGGLRISVCCAGIGWAERTASSRGPHQLQPFETVIRVNLIGTFNVLRIAAAAMLQNGPG